MNFNDLIIQSQQEAEAGMHEASIQSAEKALRLAKQDNNSPQIATALHILGATFGLVSQYSLGLEYLHQSLEIKQELGVKADIVITLFYIGKMNDSLSNHSQALSYYQQSLEIYQELDMTENIAKNLSNIGGVYSETGDFSMALDYYEKALAINEQLGRKSGIALCLGNIGGIYSGLSDYTRTLEYNQKALAIYEVLGSTSGIASRLCNIGLVYGSLSDFTRELEYLQRSLVLFQQLGNKEKLAHTLNYIGTSYRNLEEYSLAVEYIKQSVAIFEELGLEYWLARSLGSLGNVYLTLNDHPLALEYYYKALSIYERVGGGKDRLTVILGNIATIYSAMDFEEYNPEKAMEYLLKGIAISEELHYKHHLYVMYQSLAKLYEQQNLWERAYKEFMKSYTLEKEVQSEGSKKQAEQMEYRRKIEESERDRQVKLARFQEREKILDNILPSQITERLIKGENPIADRSENVSVFFSDIVGFTTLSRNISAKDLVSGLNTLFIQYDALAQKHGLEKIKTIGDAYMAVCGVPTAMEDHAERMARFALDIQALFLSGVSIAGHLVNVRIGLHCGEVVAGVIGEQKFAYDLWGDAVNTASRMESHGEAGKIHVSEEFMHALSLTSPMSLHFIERGEMGIKGKGMMKTYFLEKANP